MRISIITLFPEALEPILNHSIIGRAKKKGLVEFELINLRDFGLGRYKQVDDKPFGGGAGMVLRVDVIAQALNSIKGIKSAHKILLTPRGKSFNQAKAEKLAKLSQIVLVCGHYEGVDERVKKLVDEEISVGPYVLSGGETAAMVVVDTIARLLPGVIKPASLKEESFAKEKREAIEYPQYTRPPEYKGIKVPEILLSGDHKKIKEWRKTHR